VCLRQRPSKESYGASVVCSRRRPSKESYRVLVVLRGDGVLLLLKLLRNFGQGQVDCKDNEVYCEFV